MTLDEAIKHCKEKAKELRTEAEQLRNIGEVISSPKQPYNEPVKNCRECAKEHEQLAEWLRDYKKLLEDQKQTGEWVVVGRAAYGYVDIECPCCKYLRQDMQADNKPNFCENCGAYMKGGAE